MIPNWVKILAGVIFLLGLGSLVVGWAGPWPIAPDERWIKNGAILALVTAIIAVITLTAGALFLILAGAWAIVTKKPSPFASLSAAQVRSIRNNTSLTVLMTLIVAGLAAIRFAFGVVQNPPQTHTWLAAEFSALGILLIGATFGFLFGLPHFADSVAASPQSGSAAAAASASSTPASATWSGSATPNPAFTPSTNLEKVSAQLVTLFSGLAFASILTIPVYINAFAGFFEQGIHDHGGSLLGAGVVTYFGPLGFITAYVVTRTIGAQAFARSDTELMGITATVTNSLPPLPDMVSPEFGDPSSLSATDLLTVQRAASVAFDQLNSTEDFQTWGRAHSLLGDLKGARRAFERAYTRSSGDPRVIIDYATALYNDPDWNDATYVFQKAKEAEALETPATSATLRARTLSLETAALLYMPARYVDAVANANHLISATLPPLPTTRFYRACALGQLLWAYAVANRLSVGSKGWDAAMMVIRFDIAVAMESGDDMRQKVQMVINPVGRKDQHDCDLQFAAGNDATLASIAHMSSPPPPPDAKYLPGLADPPNVSTAPAWDADIVAWVKTFPP